MDKISLFQQSKEQLLKINKIYEQTLKSGKMSKLDFDLLLNNTRNFYETLLQFQEPEATAMHRTPTANTNNAQAINVNKPTVKFNFIKKENDHIETSTVKENTTPIENTFSENITSSYELNELNSQHNTELNDTFSSNENKRTLQNESNELNQQINSLPNEIESKIEEIKETPISITQENGIAPINISHIENQADTDLNELYTLQAETLPKSNDREKDLTKMIGFNERYIFLSELFQNHVHEYETVINDLNSLHTKEICINKLKQHWKPKYNWADDNEGYQYLCKLIELKFG